MASRDTLTPAEALPGVVIELTGEDGRTRRVTDSEGRFHFGTLAYSAYTLRVITAYLPEQHYVDQEVQTFDLEAGERRETQFRVRPRRRTIRLIETEPVKMKGTAEMTQVGPAQEMPSGAVHAVQAEDTIRKLDE